jgi:ABC-type sugar transport system ATPase subunit
VSSVKLNSIRKSLDKNPILRGISLDIEDGELVVLVGPSGCGKSTLLRTLAGLEIPDEGEIHIGSRRVEKLEPRDRNIAMVFQSYALYPHMNVRDNLAFALRLRAENDAKVKDRVDEIAGMLGIEMLLERYPRQLSGGQRQRVAMGRALVRQADVYLLDEPLSNLDAALRTQTRVEIKKLHARLKATMIYVTHDQIEAMTLADKLVVLKSGEVMQVGSPAELFDRPANAFVATFLGTPPMNLLRAKVSEGRLLGDGVDLRCPPGIKVSDNVIVGLRPHDLVAITADVEQQTETRGVIRASVEAVEPLGWDANLHLRAGEQKFIARSDAAFARTVKDGQSIALTISPDAVHLFDTKTEKAISHGSSLAT